MRRDIRTFFEVDEIGSVEVIRVQDDGTGINFDNHIQAFKNYGGSLKLGRDRTRSGRRMLGKSGKGRFRVLGLGSQVIWISRFRDADGVKEFQ